MKVSIPKNIQVIIIQGLINKIQDIFDNHNRLTEMQLNKMHNEVTNIIEWCNKYLPIFKEFNYIMDDIARLKTL